MRSAATVTRSQQLVVLALAAFGSVAASAAILLSDSAVEALPRVSLPLAIIGIFGAIVLMRFYLIGLPLLIALVYLNLSQALVRYHEFPSVLQLLVVALAFAAWWRRDTESVSAVTVQPLTIALVAYFAILLVTTTYATDRELADARVFDIGRAFVIYFLATLMIRTRKRFESAISALIASAVLLSLFAILQVATGRFDLEFGGLARIKDAQIYGDVYQARIAGPLGDPNFFAQILLLPVPFVAVRLWRANSTAQKVLYAAAGAAIAIGALLTYSRGAMLALGLMGVLLFISLHVNWKRSLAVAMLFVIAFFFLPQNVAERFFTIEEIVSKDAPIHPDSSFEERKLFMAVAWEMFGANPIAGVGAANYTARYEEYSADVSSAAREYADPSNKHFPHNLYLEVAAETGVIGLVSFAAIIIAAAVAVWRGRKSGDPTLHLEAEAVGIALVGFLVTSLFLHLAFPRYLWLLFAFAASVERLGRSETELTS